MLRKPKGEEVQILRPVPACSLTAFHAEPLWPPAPSPAVHGVCPMDAGIPARAVERIISAGGEDKGYFA